MSGVTEHAYKAGLTNNIGIGQESSKF